MAVIEDKKISLRFFLEKRLKGEEFNGEMYYPVYVRINFLGNNTGIKLLDRFGRKFVMTEKGLKSFNDYYNKGNIDRLFFGETINLLDKEALILKAVEHEYKQNREHFKFESFTENLRFYEKDVSLMLHSVLENRLMELTKKLTNDLHYIKGLSTKELFLSSGAFKSWREQLNLNAYSLPNEVKDFAAATIVYTQFVLAFFNTDSKEYGTRLPTERGTIFSWLYGEDKQDFIQFASVDQGWNNVEALSVVRYFSPEFIRWFKPEPSKTMYSQLIDNQIERNNL